MRTEDLATVTQLETQSYEFPWTHGIFQDCLRVGYLCHVLEDEHDRIIGYCIVSIAAGEAHILNLCVAPDLRKQGLGRYLLNYLLGIARAAACQKIFLEVRPSNQAALVLYGKHGFAQIGIRRDYYRAHEGKEDAIVLGLAMGATALE